MMITEVNTIIIKLELAIANDLTELSLGNNIFGILELLVVVFLSGFSNLQ